MSFHPATTVPWFGQLLLSQDDQRGRSMLADACAALIDLRDTELTVGKHEADPAIVEQLSGQVVA